MPTMSLSDRRVLRRCTHRQKLQQQEQQEEGAQEGQYNSFVASGTSTAARVHVYSREGITPCGIPTAVCV